MRAYNMKLNRYKVVSVRKDAIYDAYSEKGAKKQFRKDYGICDVILKVKKIK